MALIRCRECGREISSAAPACPGCGYPQQKRANDYGRWRPVIFASAVAVALAGFLYKSKPTPRAVEDSHFEMRVTAPSPVCRDDGLYNNLLDLVLKKDREAAQGLLDPAIANNQCQILEAGQVVTIESGASLPCVRWKGEPECWYISPTLMEVIP
jgi:hypothetical protein